jgi:hypothetical protein
VLSRTLLSAPESAMGTRLSRPEAPETSAAIARYGARLLSILETPSPLAQGKPNELVPRPLPLSDPAARLWRAFGDSIEVRLSHDGALRPISGLANKLPEHAARIAGVLTLVRHIGAGEIAATEVAAGIELAQHYAAEALRLHGGSQISAELRAAQQALNWILCHWREPAISLPDLYQRGPNSIRDAKIARQIVAILEDHGWLYPIPQGSRDCRNASPRCLASCAWVIRCRHSASSTLGPRLNIAIRRRAPLKSLILLRLNTVPCQRL